MKNTTDILRLFYHAVVLGLKAHGIKAQTNERLTIARFRLVLTNMSEAKRYYPSIAQTKWVGTLEHMIDYAKMNDVNPRLFQSWKDGRAS